MRVVIKPQQTHPSPSQATHFLLSSQSSAQLSCKSSKLKNCCSRASPRTNSHANRRSSCVKSLLSGLPSHPTAGCRAPPASNESIARGGLLVREDSTVPHRAALTKKGPLLAALAFSLGTAFIQSTNPFHRSHGCSGVHRKPNRRSASHRPMMFHGVTRLR